MTTPTANTNPDLRIPVPPANIKIAPTFWGKVWEAIKLIFVVLAGVALFVANPELFTIGFTIGIVFDAKVKEISEKIMRICNENTWKVFTLIGIGAFLCPAVTIATVSIGYGARLAYSLLNQNEGKKVEEAIA